MWVWGPPGCSKSTCVRQAAAGLGLAVVDVRAATTDPVDWRGVPTVADGRTTWCPPDFLPKDGEGVLFLDELPNAPPLVMSALLELCLDRRLAGYALPPGWRVVAAGNRQEDRAGAGRVISSLLNRFVHLDLGVDLDEWLAWAAARPLAPEVVAFVRGRGPDALFAFDPSRPDRAYPTPRSWEFAARVVDAFRGPGGAAYAADTAGLLHAALAGCVGPGPAAELVAHLELTASLPDPRALLAAARTAPLPTEPSLVCAALTAAAAVARAEPPLRPAYAHLLGRVAPEYAWFGLTQLLSGLPAADRAAVAADPSVLAVLAACGRGGVHAPAR